MYRRFASARVPACSAVAASAEPVTRSIDSASDTARTAAGVSASLAAAIFWSSSVSGDPGVPAGEDGFAIRWDRALWTLATDTRGRAEGSGGGSSSSYASSSIVMSESFIEFEWALEISFGDVESGSKL
jgi:hypothetical protein